LVGVLSSRTLLGPTDRPLGPAPSDRTIDDDEVTRPPQLRDRRREAISSLAAGLCRPCCGCPHPVDQQQQASSTPSSDQRPGRGPRMLRRGRRYATEISFADGPRALAGKHALLARPKGCRPIPLYSLCQDACRERAGRDPAAVGRRPFLPPPRIGSAFVRKGSKRGAVPTRSSQRPEGPRGSDLMGLCLVRRLSNWRDYWLSRQAAPLRHACLFGSPASSSIVLLPQHQLATKRASCIHAIAARAHPYPVVQMLARPPFSQAL
jgi:hypothetical protein